VYGPCTTVYRAQMTYEIDPLFVECFGGVTVQRAEVTSCNFVISARAATGGDRRPELQLVTVSRLLWGGR